MKVCIACLNGTRDGTSVECAAPQIGELAALIIGEVQPKAKMDAGLVRLNPGLCGAHGQWFSPRPVVPEIKNAQPPKAPPSAAQSERDLHGRPAA